MDGNMLLFSFVLYILVENFTFFKLQHALKGAFLYHSWVKPWINLG